MEAAVEAALEAATEAEIQTAVEAVAAEEEARKQAAEERARKQALAARQSNNKFRFDIDEDSDKSVAEQLRDALIENSVRVVDLFKDWDDDQSGTVSRKEFHKAMDEMQFNVPKEAIDALFSEWDPDNSGALELRELERLLKRRVQIADNLQAGAMGEIETESKAKHALRKGGAGEGSSLKLDIDEDSDKSVAQQLKEALLKNAVRIVDLFKDWDDDQSGTVTRDEFHKAMAELEFNVPKEAIDELFSQWDPDNSGSLELKELEKILKRGDMTEEEQEAQVKLQAAARGRAARKAMAEQRAAEEAALEVPTHPQPSPCLGPPPALALAPAP